MRIEKVSIFKLPDGFNFMPLKDCLTGARNGRSRPANAKQPDRYDLLESPAPTQDSTETLPLSARNRERKPTSSSELLQHAVDGTNPGEPKMLFEDRNGRPRHPRPSRRLSIGRRQAER
ncbi:hypothetical protein [Mesorhizobium sp.]|uniref:hypothetical protein n=1 Tax=Mesorhizobium sp. TaxID=1871066 RepID=UPI0025FC2048|nr:hypothetical protein [Mesorhizobium sp.]